MGAIEDLLSMSLWRASVIALLSMLWIAGSAAITANVDMAWYGITAVLAVFWLVYLFFVYTVVEWGRQHY